MSGSRLSFDWTAKYPTPSKALWTRKSIEAVDGFTVMNTGQDIDLENRLKRKGFRVPREAVGQERTYYIYRWTSESYHLSISGADGYAAIGKRPVIAGDYTLNPRDTGHYVTTLRKLPGNHA
jgi:hypothetical protein